MKVQCGGGRDGINKEWRDGGRERVREREGCHLYTLLASRLTVGVLLSWIT